MSGAPTDASPACGHPASELLDFHVNGSLEGGEAAMVAAHVQECAACARDVRELRSLSTAIATHGADTAPALAPGTRLWASLGTVAAVVALGIGLHLWFGRNPLVPAPVSGAAPGLEVVLDLGVGGLRDAGAEPPTLRLPSAAANARLMLSPPVLPEEDLRIGVRGPDDSEVVPEAPLPPRDAMGRITLAVPASRLSGSGVHRVILRRASDHGDLGGFSYPFRVEHSDR